MNLVEGRQCWWLSAASCLRSRPVLCRKYSLAQSCALASLRFAGLAAARALEARPAAGDGEQEGAAGVEAGSMPEAEDVRWQLSEAVAAERAMLHRLECEIRR